VAAWSPPRQAVSGWPFEALAEDQEESGNDKGDGGVRVTTVERLLDRKQRLIEQLLDSSSAEERDEIERMLEKIDTALNLLGDGSRGISEDDEE
jgi:hypothetical protein